MRSLALIRENGDLGTEMGTQKLKKVPMGTGSPKWGPMWPQWNHDQHAFGPTPRLMLRGLDFFVDEKSVFWYTLVLTVDRSQCALLSIILRPKPWRRM